MGMTIDEFEEYAKSHNILIMTRELYENRLKAILVELQLEIREHDPGCGWEGYADKNVIDCIIQERINSLKGE